MNALISKPISTPQPLLYLVEAFYHTVLGLGDMNFVIAALPVNSLCIRPLIGTLFALLTRIIMFISCATRSLSSKRVNILEDSQRCSLE